VGAGPHAAQRGGDLQQREGNPGMSETIALEGGNAAKYLDAVGFIPLPDFIRALSENQINAIR
jgi:hypothetical protein